MAGTTSALDDWFEDVDAVYVLDRDGRFGDILLTADPAVMNSYPQEMWCGPLWYLPRHSRGAETKMLYRGNEGRVYTNDSSEVEFFLEETLGEAWVEAVDDSVMDLIQPARKRGRGRGSRLRRSGIGRATLGYGWMLRDPRLLPGADFTQLYPYDKTTRSVSMGGETHTISLYPNCGGMIARWQAQIDAISETKDLINTLGYGRGFHHSGQIVLDGGLSTEWRHGPNPGGPDTGFRSATPNSDWFADQPTPSVTHYWESAPEGELIVVTEGMHVDFSPGGAPQHPVPPPFTDEGGSYLNPVLYTKPLLGRVRLHINWGGEGVHLFDGSVFVPEHISGIVGGQVLNSFRRWNLFSGVDWADNVWLYDAANDTETAGAINLSLTGHQGYIVNLDEHKEDAQTGGASIGPGIPSGYGATIKRDQTGAAGSGTGNDFAMGIGALIGTNNQASLGKRPDQLNYSANLEAARPGGVFGWDVVSQRVTTNALGLDAGWTTIRNVIVTGTYATVKSRLRNLYLSGKWPQSYPLNR